MLTSFFQLLTDYETVISAIVGLISLCVAAWGLLRLAAGPHGGESATAAAPGEHAGKSDKPGWQSVFSLGVTEHSQLEELVSVRVVNVALFSLIVLSFPWIIIDLLWIRSTTFITFVVLAVFSGSILGLALQRAGATTAARWLVIVMAACYWLSALLVVGPMQGTEYFLAGLMSLPVLILSRAQVLQRFLSIAVIGAVFFIGVSVTHGQPVSPPLSEGLLDLRYHANALFLAAIIVATVSYYKKFAATSYDLLSSRKQQNDALVSRLMPADIAQQVADREPGAAKWHPEGTVLIASLAGFSELYTRLPAIDIVTKLDDLYSRFDEIVDAHKLIKVKTLGTTYVAASGLDGSVDRNPSVASAALALRMAVEEFAREQHLPIQLRCAIATGLTISGVIGRSRPRFDIWGAALDEATALKPEAAAGDILVNETAYWRLNSFFEFDQQGLGDSAYRLIAERLRNEFAS